MNDEDQTPAWRDGWLAHKHGISVDDNPYDARSQTHSNALWLSGWCARFSWRKHGEPGDTSPFDEAYS